jgi:hypothetical protein
MRVRLALLAVTLLLAAACGEDATTPAGDDPTGSDGPLSVSPTTFASGSETVSLGGDLPDGFPESFPLPDGSEVLFSGSAGDSYAIWFSSDLSFDDLKSYFGEELSSSGWSTDAPFEGSAEGAEFAVYTVTGNGYSGGVMLGTGAPGAEGFEEEFAFFVTLTPE